jgi:transcriptional regulator with XRE-family HTH domain
MDTALLTDVPDPELIGPALARLRGERTDENGKPWSRSVLSRKTVRPGFAGISEATIKAIETEAGRVPKAHIIEALAAALGVPPETFYEYPIAAARDRGEDVSSLGSDEQDQAEARRLKADADRLLDKTSTAAPRRPAAKTKKRATG